MPLKRANYWLLTSSTISLLMYTTISRFVVSRPRSINKSHFSISIPSSLGGEREVSKLDIKSRTLTFFLVSEIGDMEGRELTN